MRAKRAAVLLSLLLSLGGAAWFSVDALSVPEEEASPAAGSIEEPSLRRESEVAAGSQVRVEEGFDWGNLFSWLGAAFFAIIFVASLVVFRVEVRREKDLNRVRKQREDYYRDLRQYNAQLRGPPKDNT